MKLGETLAKLGRPIAFYPSLARVVGGLAPGVLLCQLAYWHGKQRDPDGWIRKTWADLEAETGLSRREQQHARANLRKLGVLEERVRGVPATVEYRIDMTALEALFEQATGATSCTGEGNQLHPAVQLDAPTGATLNRCSEITTETTPEKVKHCRARAPDVAHEVLEYVNDVGKTHFQPVEPNLRLIRARLREVDEWTLAAMTRRQWSAWRGTDMQRFFRPETLFNATKCAQYVGQLTDTDRAWIARKRAAPPDVAVAQAVPS